jgi:hypothetical protein
MRGNISSNITLLPIHSNFSLYKKFPSEVTYHIQQLGVALAKNVPTRHFLVLPRLGWIPSYIAICHLVFLGLNSFISLFQENRVFKPFLYINT